MPVRNSFDHFVGGGEQRRRHWKPKRLGGLEVDHQLVPGRRLHRQIGRFLALEDAVDISCRTLPQIGYVRPVGDQAAVGDEEPPIVDRGQLVPGCQSDDQLAMRHRLRARRYDQAAIAGAREGRDSAPDLAGIADIDRAYLDPQRRRHRLNRGELAWPGGYGLGPE
jgi:hypothetical protein